MKEFFKDVAEDKTITSAFLTDVFFIIVAIGYILLSYGKLPPLIPIFNQMPWGEQRLGATFTIFIPVIIAILILAINLLMSTLIYKQIPLISRMFAAVSLLIGILTSLLIIRTITLIT